MFEVFKQNHFVAYANRINRKIYAIFTVLINLKVIKHTPDTATQLIDCQISTLSIELFISLTQKSLLPCIERSGTGVELRTLD